MRGAHTGSDDMATSVGLCIRAHTGGGHPQGGPLRARMIWQRALGWAHEGAHTGGGHPQGVPLRV